MAFKLPGLGSGDKKPTSTDMASDLTTIMESSGAPKPRPSPRSAAASQAPAGSGGIQTLTAVFILLVAVTIGLLVFQGRESARSTVYVAAAGELQMRSQQIAKAAQLALQGENSAFVELREGATRFGALVDAMGGGGWGPIVASNLIVRGKDVIITVGSVNAVEFFVTLAASITEADEHTGDHPQKSAAAGTPPLAVSGLTTETLLLLELGEPLTYVCAAA